MHRTGWWQTSGSSRRGSSGAITERFQIWSVHNIRIETFCQESAAMYVPEDLHIGSVQKDQYPLKFFKKIRSMDSGSRRGYLEKTRPSKSVSKKKKKKRPQTFLSPDIQWVYFLEISFRIPRTRCLRMALGLQAARTHGQRAGQATGHLG